MDITVTEGVFTGASEHIGEENDVSLFDLVHYNRRVNKSEVNIITGLLQEHQTNRFVGSRRDVKCNE